MLNIKLNKINKGYAADPNLSEPVIKLYGNTVYLEFLLNSYIFNFKEGDIGQVLFNNCVAFRAGSPNDEGLYIDPKNPSKINNSIWNKTDFPYIDFDSFYEVENSDWSSVTDYGGYLNQKMMQEAKSKQNFRHFVFFMKEGTFECVAESYEEHIPI